MKRARQFVPPKRSFADAGHFACALALLDAQERLRMAYLTPDVAGKRFYARHTLVSCRDAANHLGASKVDLPDGKTARPEKSRQNLGAQVHSTAIQAEQILRKLEPRNRLPVLIPPGAIMVFAFTPAGPVLDHVVTPEGFL